MPKKMKSAAQIIMNKIKRGATNLEALDAARKVHPRTTISLPSVNWYRNRLRDQGRDVPNDREARRRKSA